MSQNIILEVKPMEGLGPLKFGSLLNEAKLIFGEPDETENLLDDILNNNSFIMHYWEKGYSLFFDANSNYAFTSVEIENEETILFNTLVFDLKENEIIELFKANGYKVSDTETHNWGEKRISFDDILVDLYFEKGRLISINFGIINDDNSFHYFPN